MGDRSKIGVSQGGSSVASPRPGSEVADALADELERLGIAGAAAILLDAHRPLLPLVRQGSIFMSPMLRPLLGGRRYEALRDGLGDPALYDRLVARLTGDGPGDRA